MITIVHDGEQAPEEGLVTLFDRVAELIAGREGIEPYDCEVSVFFSDEDEIRQLNADYRGIDRPTDVLSFPMLEAKGDSSSLPLPATRDTDNDGPSEPSSALAPIMLGDVVICRDIAKKQAEEYGHSEERELAFLFTHGLFHLLGYDHEGADAEAMRTAEEEVLAVLGLAT